MGMRSGRLPSPALDPPAAASRDAVETRVGIDRHRHLHTLEQREIRDAVGVEDRFVQLELFALCNATGKLDFARTVAHRLNQTAGEAATVVHLQLRADHVLDAELPRERLGGVGRGAGHDRDQVAGFGVPVYGFAGSCAHLGQDVVLEPAFAGFDHPGLFLAAESPQCLLRHALRVDHPRGVL